MADDEAVYLTTGFGMTSLLAITMTGAEGDVTKSHIKWKAKRDILETRFFVLSKNHLYLIDDTGRLACINKKERLRNKTGHDTRSRDRPLRSTSP